MKLSSKCRPVWKSQPNSILTRAWIRWERDLAMTLGDAGKKYSKQQTDFIINIDAEMGKETYTLTLSERVIYLDAGDELGFIYGLLFLSERFLGVQPFWFWNDQVFTTKAFVEIPEASYQSEKYEMAYRGWFINDEVLLDAWGRDSIDEATGIVENNAFEMAMEALLRLGGNLVIPGTDMNSHKYKMLASDMGLYVTHHHAEPLGARMFARAFPDLVPSYKLYPEEFEGLWRKAIEDQKDYKVIWSVGFRGQGDRPFWEDDDAYDTPQKRGDLISKLIQRQYEILCEYVDDPICCTNLYGEVMELYQEGYIELPENVIYVWADNGYGKMVTRRHGQHNPRIEALPLTNKGMHGCYYHVSFYDLQAASHMTMLPNSTEFITKEMYKARERGIKDFIVINCSNVRPHTFMLDLMAKIWGKKGMAYTRQYYPNCADEVESLYQAYANAMIQIGHHEDDHGGDQFYHYTIRSICHGWMLSNFDRAEPSLTWLAGDYILDEQVERVSKLVENGEEKMTSFYRSCQSLAEALDLRRDVSSGEAQLFKDVVLLQATIHYYSMLALIDTCDAYRSFGRGDYETAFYQLGNGITRISSINEALQAANHDHWQGFYDNDCLTDIKFTSYSLKQVMGYIRNIGDGPHYYSWQLKYMNPSIGHKVVLITNMRNRVDDQEIYQAMKEIKGQVSKIE